MNDKAQLSSSLSALKNELTKFQKRSVMFKHLWHIALVTTFIFLALFILFLILFLIVYKSSDIFLIFDIIFLVLFFLALNSAMFFYLFQKYVYSARIKNHQKLVDIVNSEINNK